MSAAGLGDGAECVERVEDGGGSEVDVCVRVCVMCMSVCVCHVFVYACHECMRLYHVYNCVCVVSCASVYAYVPCVCVYVCSMHTPP